MTTTIRSTTHKLRSLYHEVWWCRRCGREFGDATACCAHEAQCGAMTHC